MSDSRSPRHHSIKYQGIHTADAILQIAEQICADLGYSQLKIATIAKELNIESPAIYKHFKGIQGITNALASESFKQLISLFDELEELTFYDAFMTFSERLIDLFIQRPGLARFLLAEFSAPQGLKGFIGFETENYEKQLTSKYHELLAKSGKEESLDLSTTSFESVGLGSALLGLALNAISIRDKEKSNEIMRQNYLETMKIFAIGIETSV